VNLYTHMWHATKAIYSEGSTIPAAPNVVGLWGHLRLGTPGNITFNTMTSIGSNMYTLSGTFHGLYGNVQYPPQWFDGQSWILDSSWSRIYARYGGYWFYLFFMEPSTNSSRSQEFFLLLDSTLTHAHGANIVAYGPSGITFDMTLAGNPPSTAQQPTDLAPYFDVNWAFMDKGALGTFQITGLNNQGTITISTYQIGNGTLAFTSCPLEDVYYREWPAASGVYFLQFQYQCNNMPAARFFDAIMDYNRNSLYGCETNYGVFSARQKA